MVALVGEVQGAMEEHGREGSLGFGGSGTLSESSEVLEKPEEE